MFKIGDRCYCDFEPARIVDMEGDRITWVRYDKGGETCGNDLSMFCFPDEPKIANCSDYAESCYSEISDLHFNSLNLPDIHRKIVEFWRDMCVHKDDDSYITIWSELTTFTSSVISVVKVMREIKILDVNAFE